MKISTIKNVLAITCLFALPMTMNAQDGALDLTFDTDGIVTMPIMGNEDVPNAMAIQPDGKFVVVGYSDNGIDLDISVARFNTDGSLDLTFGAGGIVTIPIGTDDELANTVVIQPDDYIVIGGYIRTPSNYDFVVVRLLPDGSNDIDFGNAGVQITPIGSSNDFGNSLALQADGKIVLAGTTQSFSTTDFAVVRYNTDGTLDNTFNFDGMVITPGGTANDYGYSVAIQSDQKIVLAGATYNTAGSSDIALIRYNTDGSLDNTFDSDGKVFTAIGTDNDAAYSVAIQTDQKIVVAGNAVSGAQNSTAVVRYTTNGSLDNTFSSDGKVTTIVGTALNQASSVAVQADGKIVTAGYAYDGTQYVFALTRYTSNGSLDITFDTDGVVTTIVGAFGGQGKSVVLQPDGNIVVAGASGAGSVFQSVFTLVRYTSTLFLAVEGGNSLSAETTINQNPFSSETFIHTDLNLQNATLTIYNVLGKQVGQLKNINGNTIMLNSENLISGVYFFDIKENEKLISSKKVIITD